MAKAEAAGKPEDVKNNDKPQAGGPPAGYKKAATDVVGFFDGDMKKPIHGYAIHVNLSDSTIEKSKPSALVFFRLIDPCDAIRSAEGEEALDKRPCISTKKDDVVGIWFSAGMRDLAFTKGVPVYMVQDGEKKIKGKPSPMKTYDIRMPKQGDKLPVREDRREQSAGVEARPFAGKKLLGASAGVDNGDAGGDDDIPF